VARIGEPSTSIRLLHPDGTPSGITASATADVPYEITPPRVVGWANELERWVRDGRVVDPSDDVMRLVAAFIAHVESSDDVASVLTAPLIEKIDRSAGAALAMAATFADTDPIFETSQASDLVRELHERAAKKDPSLWASRLWLLVGQAEKKGPEEAVRSSNGYRANSRCARRSSIPRTGLRGLGWTAERPYIKGCCENTPIISLRCAALEVADTEGDTRTSDALLIRSSASTGTTCSSVALAGRLRQIHRGLDRLANLTPTAKISPSASTR
jgi:hypothetical protein